MSSDPAALANRTPSAAPPRPSFLALRDRPDAIHRLRVFVGAAVFGLPYTADEIELIAVELVTNAILHTRKLTLPEEAWPIGVEMTATSRYMHLAITDPDHRPIAGIDKGGQLAEHGRGLGIIDHLAAARWVVYAEHGKTMHVVVAASGVVLASEELRQIGVPT
ncbi:ATP-binding protein [Actinoallomurus sp. NPDC050550]|uniref:ATP-binding protein n=1 Tax=Actinoallomurus sp. NPDC050550 TaxID=3154937 RepID=UPI0033DD8DCF